jgi:hypothetical protein
MAISPSVPMYGGKRDPQYICFGKKTPPPVGYQERSRKSFINPATLLSTIAASQRCIPII